MPLALQTGIEVLHFTHTLSPDKGKALKSLGLLPDQVLES